MRVGYLRSTIRAASSSIYRRLSGWSVASCLLSRDSGWGNRPPCSRHRRHRRIAGRRVDASCRFDDIALGTREVRVCEELCCCSPEVEHGGPHIDPCPVYVFLGGHVRRRAWQAIRSEEHTSELQSL